MSVNFEQVLTESEIELYQKLQQVFESFKSSHGSEAGLELTRIYFDALSRMQLDDEIEYVIEDLDEDELEAGDEELNA